MESVIEHLITELRVVPVRADWQDTLEKGRSDFVRWRTWGQPDADERTDLRVHVVPLRP